jgi:hypothetical protein
MKPELKVINPLPPQDPPDYARIYRRLIQECTETENPSKDWKKRFIYLVIKGLPVVFDDVISRGSESLFLSKELLSRIWVPIEEAQKQMGLLTPNEFMTVFPIEKEYDGHRYGVMDYHSTMGVLKKIGMDTRIGEHAQLLLFDYQNQYVFRFNVFKMKFVDRLRASKGQTPIIESFLTKTGLYSKQEILSDENGISFAYDSMKLTTYPKRKKSPRLFESDQITSKCSLQTWTG